MTITEALGQIGEATRIEKRAISAPSVLNEAFHYARPSSFSRALRIDAGNVAILLISGTASVDENGATIHEGDFRAQIRRTYRNITELLNSAGATWHDIVRTTCYLRDIERDYAAFNEERTAFYAEQGLNPLPASTGIGSQPTSSHQLVRASQMNSEPLSLRIRVGDPRLPTTRATIRRTSAPSSCRPHGARGIPECIHPPWSTT